MLRSDQIVEALAELTAGLQAPLSIGALGAAQAPFRSLYGDIPGYGWRTVDDFRPYWAVRIASAVPTVTPDSDAERLARAESLLISWRLLQVRHSEQGELAQAEYGPDSPEALESFRLSSRYEMQANALENALR